MPSHDFQASDRVGADPTKDPGLDSYPEPTLAVGEELLSRARDVARDIEDRIRRTLGTPDGTDPTPA
jgi:hypothetical protein